jgi:hypothetical protein
MIICLEFHCFHEKHRSLNRLIIIEKPIEKFNIPPRLKSWAIRLKSWAIDLPSYVPPIKIVGYEQTFDIKRIINRWNTYFRICHSSMRIRINALLSHYEEGISQNNKHQSKSALTLTLQL